MRRELSRRRFLELSAVGIAAHSLPISSAQNDAHRKPNIIYINVDDLGWTDLGFQGSKYYETPNIDRLASQGMVFTNAYAPAANCAPSRACCMTGQYTPRHGVYTVGTSERGKTEDRKLVPTPNTRFIEDDNLTIAHGLKSAGYRTCTIGKWHISRDPRTNGFDVNIAGREWGAPRKGYFRTTPYAAYPGLEDGPEGEYLTDRLTDEAIRFVEKNRESPFFLYLPYYTVHSPHQAKPDKVAAFSTKESTDAHDSPTYAAMIQSLDEGVGRLLQRVEDLGLAGNTLVLFTSDNGGLYRISRQWPLRCGKGSYYEGGIREPMIVRWPGRVAPGSTCDVPVSGIDFFPTLLETADAKIPSGKVLDGVSIMPLLGQTGSIADRPLFWHFPIYLQAYRQSSPESRDPKFRTRPGSAVRYGDWKLHEYFEDGGLELYNLREDLGEKDNLIEREPEKVRELHGMLKDWRSNVKAPVPTELNPMYQPTQ